ncbi:hypothetical protein NDU88_003860 [Pleurodeles waltl]|uniref:Uncharacterized protein n=1 Tax=Pleurodeles waltl TaxID=8319 RepID=A0AAV7MVI0_PLEWA|nr:hypothetical protein NDU88_003860 [Pleurodeles waltl]
MVRPLRLPASPSGSSAVFLSGEHSPGGVSVPKIAPSPPGATGLERCFPVTLLVPVQFICLAALAACRCCVRLRAAAPHFSHVYGTLNVLRGTEAPPKLERLAPLASLSFDVDCAAGHGASARLHCAPYVL